MAEPCEGEVHVRTALDEQHLDEHGATVRVPLRWKVKSLLIGELAARTGVPAKTLRFYEDAGVLPEPARTPAGYRVYGEEAVDRLAFIRSAQAAALTLAEIRTVIGIRDGGSAPCAHVVEVLDEKSATVTRQLAELRALKRELDRLRASARGIDPSSCDPGSVCEVLRGDAPKA